MNDNEFYRISTVTGKSYDVFKCIKIVNPKQAAFYVDNEVELRDIKVVPDRKTQKPVFLYYFYRDETKTAYDIWCKNKEQENEN